MSPLTPRLLFELTDMDLLNSLLDHIYYGALEPLFALIASLLSRVLFTPLASLHLPPWLHIAVLAVGLAFFAFFLRRILRVEEKINTFNASFAKKRERQQDLQLISDKQSRDTLYRATDEELNKVYNTFIANHYSRYVCVYLLPLFLLMAWMNQVFNPAYLLETAGRAYVLSVPENSAGVQGLTPTFVFLCFYVVSLIFGFQVIRRRRAARL